MTNAAKNGLQTTRKKPTRRGFKRPPRDLGEWIRLANLVPVGASLPDLDTPLDGQFSWALVVERIARLGDPLSSELLGHMTQERAEAWVNSLGRPPKQTSSEFAAWLRARIDTVRLRFTLEHYDKIRLAYQQLRMLSRGEPEHAWDGLESLVSTLRYTELSYLRQCGVCDRIFYAKRRTQIGCTTRHQTIIRKREKYKRDKAQRDSERMGSRKRRPK